MKTHFLLFVLLFIGNIGIANIDPVVIQQNQTQNSIPKIKALNHYVDFINESTHGMLIVVKLLENFNLDINKYVDLASYQINQYNNDDLPKDIFEDTDRLFYEIPPYELYDMAIKSGRTLNSKAELDALAANMKTILGKINQIRFDLEGLIQGKDLTDRNELGKVYQKLEEAVNRYEDFFVVQKKMERVIYKEARTVNKSFGSFQTLFDKMQTVYGSSRELLIRLRDKETNQFLPILKKFNNSAEEMINYSLGDDDKVKTSKFKFNWNNYLNAVKNINAAFNEFQNDGAVSEQYQIYGKYYYYYNVNCISKFNRYGTGIVVGMNNIIDLLDLPTVKLTELPHYFKVIYPKKLEKVDFVESSMKNINYIPEEIKSRKVSSTNKKIRVTNDIVEFLFFDHMIADGDLVSVNFNGEWIMEKEELEIAPKKFKLKLNREGKNYLLLHADNVGQRPPCTIGVSYMMGGTKKEIILSSDFEVSEMIELHIIE